MHSNQMAFEFQMAEVSALAKDIISIWNLRVMRHYIDSKDIDLQKKWIQFSPQGVNKYQCSAEYGAVIFNKT